MHVENNQQSAGVYISNSICHSIHRHVRELIERVCDLFLIFFLNSNWYWQ